MGSIILVEEWKSSNLTKGDFAVSKSVTYHSFNYWIQKYNNEHSRNESEVSFFSLTEKVSEIKNEGKKIMMIGDGLNDAGKLDKSDVGIAVSEDIFRFTPSSDAIIEASKLHLLPSFISISQFSKIVLKSCLGFSVSYNIVGLSIEI